MLRRIALAGLLALCPALASAQLAILAPTPPAADSSDRIANTAWVNLWAGSAMPLASGKIWIGSAGNIAAPQTMSADATLSILGAMTLATVNANVGSFGSATQCPTLTVNGKGLVTAASAATCTPAVGSITGLGTGVATALAIAANGSGGFIGPTPTRAGDVSYWNGSAWTSIAGNNSGTNCLQENASGVPSWATCGGGGGTPGGSNTQVQYNNSGAFGGITGATTNGTALTLVAPVLGTPASATLTNATGLPISTGLTGAGTGVLTALGVNVGSAGAFVTFNGALGTPSSGTATNLTGTAASLTAGNATNTAITDDTATNATMFPTWVTANTGNLPQKVTSTKFTFNPSTGVLSSTSFTGAGTGLTGTAASLTSGTVTTNANLTGPVTSVGNATAIANSTITNAMLANSSVTYGTTTVALGASNTAIAGLTSVGLTSGSTINWNSDTFIGRGAAANEKHGQADAASPVAQTISVQNVVAGTSNTAGAGLTIAGSQGTGTGVGGAIHLQVAPAGTTGTAQNALSTALEISGTGSVGVGTTTTTSAKFTAEDGSGNNQMDLRYTGKVGFLGNQQSNGNFSWTLADNAVLTMTTNNGSGGTVTLGATGGVSVGTPNDLGANNLSVAGAVACAAPITKTGTSGTVGNSDCSIIFNASGTYTATLPAASSYTGRWLYTKSIAAQTINSASSNVVPLAGGAAGTALLASGAGKWANLQSDGTNWIIMSGN